MTVLFIALALFVGIYLVTNQVLFSPRASDPVETYTKIQSDDDLDRANMSLDEVDLDSLDADLNQNEQDASSY